MVGFIQDQTLSGFKYKKSREMTNIKFFGISIFKQKKS